VKIRNIKAIYEDAVNSNQLEKLKPYIAKNFHGVMVNGREARSYDDLVKIVADVRDLIGAGGSYQVKVNYEPGTMFGNLAVANGTTEEHIVTGSGKRFDPNSNWLAGRRSNLFRLYLDWELGIPFVPWMIYVYLSINFFLALPVFVLDIDDIRRFAKAFAWVTLAAALAHQLLPTQLGWQRPAQL